MLSFQLSKKIDELFDDKKQAVRLPQHRATFEADGLRLKAKKMGLLYTLQVSRLDRPILRQELLGVATAVQGAAAVYLILMSRESSVIKEGDTLRYCQYVYWLVEPVGVEVFHPPQQAISQPVLFGEVHHG